MSPPGVAEAHDVLVIIIDFQDESRPTDLRYKDGIDYFVPFTVANAQDVFFDAPTSSAERFLEMSNGLMTITGTVIETTLAMNIGDSEVGDWRPAADAAAAGQGHPTSNYDRVAYLLPYGFKNQLGVGGAGTDWCWVVGINSGNAYLRESVFSHELGHTLGLSHANVILPNDTVTNVADMGDLMGLSEAIHPAGVNKWNKGWFDGARHALHPLDGVSAYALYPLASDLVQLQAVHIDNHGALPALGDPFDTVVTFRKPIGFDSNIALTAIDPTNTPLRDTVHIHHTRKTGSEDSYLVKALASGEQYQTCGLTIQAIAITAATAQVLITQTPYNPVAPGLTAWPQGSSAVYAGTPVFYDLDVTNYDGGTGACEAFYDQEVTLPGPGWSGSWVSAGLDVSLGLGAMETFDNFVVNSPIGTPPGIYNVSLKLTNNGGSGAPVEETVDFQYEVVPSPDTEPPTAPTGLVANEFFPNYVVLTWTASTDNVGIATYRVFHNGFLLPDGGATTAYIDFPPPSGGYTPGGTNGYVVYAIDAAGNLSPPSNWAFVGDDLVAPSIPANLIGVVTFSEVALVWDDSTDNVGVTSYDILRDGMVVGSSPTADFVDTAVAYGASYSYTVVARDGWGNASAPSAPFMADIPTPTFAEVPSVSPLGGTVLIGLLLGSGFAIRRFSGENGRFTGSPGNPD